MFYHKRKGQGTLEYAIIIAVIVAALLAIQVYFKRGLQGRIRQASDDIGDQFSPAFTTGARNTVLNASQSENIAGAITRIGSTQNQQVVSNQVVANQVNEIW